MCALDIRRSHNLLDIRPEIWFERKIKLKNSAAKLFLEWNSTVVQCGIRIFDKNVLLLDIRPKSLCLFMSEIHTPIIKISCKCQGIRPKKEFCYRIPSPALLKPLLVHVLTSLSKSLFRISSTNLYDKVSGQKKNSVTSPIQNKVCACSCPCLHSNVNPFSVYPVQAFMSRYPARKGILFPDI